MSIIAVLITSLLEQQKYLIGLRLFFNIKLIQYSKFFISREFKNQREIRYSYLAACAPIVLLLVLFNVFLAKYIYVYILLKFIIFIFCVEILTWKEEAKNMSQIHKSFAFIHTYATKFFAPLFWYLVVPTEIGLVCYIIIMSISAELKTKGIDLVVYNIVVDKMLFYANVIPYCILYIFIAIAGDFENVTHYLLSQRKNFTKSFYFLDDVLHDIILIAVDNDKFKANSDDLDNADAGSIETEVFTPQMTTYIVAVLYRAGLFFIGVIALIAVGHIAGLIG